MKKKLTVPIYGAALWLVVTDNVVKERRKWEHLFGPGPIEHDYDALCSHTGGHTFALFFAIKPLCLELVSHEVFHLTHRILEWANSHFDSGHHEQGALLHGYLMKEIITCLKAR